MNSRLQEAIEKVSRLSDADQEQLAAIIEEELGEEAKWESAFNPSQPQLKRLAEEALKDYREGRTEPLDPYSL